MSSIVRKVMSAKSLVFVTGNENKLKEVSALTFLKCTWYILSNSFEYSFVDYFPKID